MYSHMTVGADDLSAAQKFYDAIFAAMGGPSAFEDPNGRLIYRHRGSLFMVTRPVNGEAASNGNGTTFGFSMENIDEAQAWHKAGVENGGTSVEDPPGWRERPAGNLFLAYLRDPAGNKLCAVYRAPE